MQQREDAQVASTKEKGKNKSTRFDNDEELEARYREVVEEKKGERSFLVRGGES